MKKQFGPITVYRSERIEVIRHGYGDYELYVDGEFVGGFYTANEAEHEGAVMLEEQARDLAAGLAVAA